MSLGRHSKCHRYASSCWSATVRWITTLAFAVGHAGFAGAERIHRRCRADITCWIARITVTSGFVSNSALNASPRIACVLTGYLAAIRIMSTGAACAAAAQGSRGAGAIGIGFTLHAEVPGGVAQWCGARAVPVLGALDAGIRSCITSWCCSRAIGVFRALDASIRRRIASRLGACTIAVGGTLDTSLCAIVANRLCSAASGIARRGNSAGGYAASICSTTIAVSSRFACVITDATERVVAIVRAIGASQPSQQDEQT